MESATLKANSNQDLFTERAISLSAFIGGPLAATYFIRRNFITFGKLDEARNTLLIGLSFFLIVFAVLMALPDEVMDHPGLKLFQILWPLGSYLIVKKYQEADIQNALETGGKKGSWLKAVWIGLASMVATLAYLFALFFLLNPDQPSHENFTTMDYSQCKVYYSDGISDGDAKAVGAVLEQIGYFHPENNNVADLSVADTIYIVSLEVPLEIWDRPGVISDMHLTLTRLQSGYSYSRSFQIELYAYNSDGSMKKRTVK